MHAGDALWFLYAELTMLERRYSTSTSTLELIGKMREAINVIGQFIKVDPPPPAMLQQLIGSIASTLSQDAAAPQTTQSDTQQSGGGGGNNFSDAERIEAARTVLDAMVDSEHFEWASMITDLHDKMHGEKPFITNRQLRAVVNIGRKGDHGQFWDVLTEDYPEAVKVVEDAAALAG